jgi:hypothetical protein
LIALHALNNQAVLFYYRLLRSKEKAVEPDPNRQHWGQDSS